MGDLIDLRQAKETPFRSGEYPEDRAFDRRIDRQLAETKSAAVEAHAVIENRHMIEHPDGAEDCEICYGLDAIREWLGA